jgi:hypothetical protein
MKKIYFLLLLISLGFTQCKKTIENIQEDLVTKAMTDGQWIVTKFIYNGTTITADFNGYHFKYYDNPKKVDAVKNGTLELTGNWGGNSADMTTWANFTGAATPLNLINGTWNITRNSWTYVEATQNSGTETKTMRLDKQ